MDGYKVKTSEILGTLSYKEKKPVGQFQTLNHPTGPSSQLSSIPLSFSQDHLDKVAMINGCKLGIQIGNEHLRQSTPLPNFIKNVEVGINTTGPQPVCVEYQRPRSHSMGLAVVSTEQQASRSHSRDSLASSGSLMDEYQFPNTDGGSEEALVEVTCNKFQRLSTGGVESPHSVSPINQCQEFKSLSGSLPFCDPDVVRKYSFGSRMATSKRQLSNHGCLSGRHGLPIDLTCKRKKSDATSASLGSVFLQHGEKRQDDRIDQSQPKEQANEDESILKSVLVGMGRKRSHTFSACSRQHFRKDVRETPMGIPPRQRVTLAKRNLGPVMGRMSEHLSRITQFLSSQMDFVKLSSNDQKNLVTNSVHRLLILYVAESNLQFVVTPVRDDDDRTADDGNALEEPTMQFAEAVQNFISKCQAMNISSSEYALMRVMTLFHTGSRAVENAAVIDRANAEAQQSLQSLVQQCYPDDRLRYSKLLLNIYTLFGINCRMLEALFCRHLIPGESGGGGGLAHFIFSEFLASRVTNS